MTDEFRPKIWTIVQIFGLLLLQRIPEIDLQKATRLTQDLVWVFAARKITSDAEIF
jgi:hypothetical protein